MINCFVSSAPPASCRTSPYYDSQTVQGLALFSQHNRTASKISFYTQPIAFKTM